jgi:ADP-ribose diphosphatase
MHIYMAFDLYPESLEGDEPEPLTVVNWHWDNLEELMIREDFTEARSVSALYMAKEKLTL